MALATNHVQGSSATFPSRPVSWGKGRTLKRYLTTLSVVGRTDRCSLIKRHICLSVGASRIHGARHKPLRIYAFQGSGEKDESGGRASGSKVSKNSVKISYVSKETGEIIAESPKAHDVSLSYTAEANQTIGGSPVIHRLFKKWLIMLRTQLPSQEVGKILGEDFPSEKVSDAQNGTQNVESGEIGSQNKEVSKIERGSMLKAVWSRFMHLDATIKIPLLIFIPSYLVVNVIYGAEVSRELTPLWVIGPLVAAFYIQLLKRLGALYIFTFKQTVKAAKTVFHYSVVVLNSITSGKLQKSISQTAVKIITFNYKKLSRRKLKEFRGWTAQKSLDYLEYIWPFYCKTIRFLKRAKLL